MSKSRLGLTAGLAVVAALLTGCGSASPGVAAQVGEEEITVNEVDEITSQYCRAVEDQLEGNGQTVPNRYFRGGIVGTLAQRSIAEQVAAEYDVEPGAVYDEKVAQLEQSVAVLEDDLEETVVEVESAQAYVEAVQAAVGEVLLEAEDTTAGEYSDTVARGEQEFEAWVSRNGVTFDPQFGVDLVKGQVSPVDTSLSQPVGEHAVAGDAEQPDPTYAAALPDNQRCG